MNRLRAFRHIEDITQAELAPMLGISPQLVSAIESGRRPPTVDLSVLGYDNDRFDVSQMSPPLHRQRASTRQASTRRVMELMRLAGEAFGELKKTAPRPLPVRIHHIETMDPLDPDVVADARAMLSHEPDGKINNLTRAVERSGVCVVPIREPRIDGMSCWVGDQPVIGVSVSIPGDRFRLTVAHEFAHLLFHTQPTDCTESEASSFASRLLISDDDFSEAMSLGRPTLRDFVAMKQAWGISVKALVYRANEMRFIDDRRHRSLQMQMSGWQQKEPATFDLVPGQAFNELLDHHGGTIAASAKLGLSAHHINRLTRWRRLEAVR